MSTELIPTDNSYYEMKADRRLSLPRQEHGVYLPEFTTVKAHRLWSWRVVWIPSPPAEAFVVECPTKETAVRVLETLGAYDMYLEKRGLAPDWSNAGWVERWTDEDGWEEEEE